MPTDPFNILYKHRDRRVTKPGLATVRSLSSFVVLLRRTDATKHESAAANPSILRNKQKHAKKRMSHTEAPGRKVSLTTDY